MSKQKKIETLKEFYIKNKKEYLKLSIEVALDVLQKDYIKIYSGYFKTEKNFLIVVKSLEEVLTNLNFNWVADLSRINKLNYFNKQGDLIKNINDFYLENKNSFIGVNNDDKIMNILDSWHDYVRETIANTGSFINDIFNVRTNILFVKEEDIKAYTEGIGGFVQKLFGDKESQVSMNFIYKEGDIEFESDNLTSKISEYKRK